MTRHFFSGTYPFRTGQLQTAFGLLVTLCALALCGCTHSQLRYSTIHQAETLSDIYERQVLNNLAMFVANPQAFPHFAIADLGTSTVTDNGQFAATSLNHFREAIGLQGGRQIAEAWQLNPIRDPRRLTLMRCAYQRVVGAGDPCIDCCELLKDWHGKPDRVVHVYDQQKKTFVPNPATNRPYDYLTPDGSPLFDEHGHLTTGGAQYIDKDGLFRIAQFDCYDPCIAASRWYCCGTWRDVPKPLRQCAGRYHDTYVWVLPPHRGELSRLTLEIMDYAVNEKSVPRMKEVVRYLDPLGNPASNADHAQQLTMTVPEDALPEVARSVADLDAEIRAIEAERASLVTFLTLPAGERKETLRQTLVGGATDDALKVHLNKILDRQRLLIQARARAIEGTYHGEGAPPRLNILGLRMQLDALAPAPPPVLRRP